MSQTIIEIKVLAHIQDDVLEEKLEMLTEGWYGVDIDHIIDCSDSAVVTIVDKDNEKLLYAAETT